ncbi:hypothetical protein GCM10012275_38490 [Longimycelium tulufanense]|uniref:Uncharacterized protein n=1 Tax=Longimycelium tulufanense TaxID=907463 RepID=A0A8J3CHY6_9PSEU|nr:hypothetical protein [Longimycelium tulufanense]GGM64240.1 hypothetical protein GCM10012275_38490 [Longimycelium tulufanense]
MRRDPTGELLDDEDDTPHPSPARPHHCHRGWQQYDVDNPVPCPVCKPNLAHRPLPEPRHPRQDEINRRGIALCRAALRTRTRSHP